MSFLYQDIENKKLYPNLKISGIYKITNKLNQKFYIGSSVNIFRRWNDHLYKKRTTDITKKQYITRALDKYGNENFVFEVLATCPLEYLIKLEQWFIDNLTPTYNIRKIADNNREVKHTKEFKEKVRNSLLLRPKAIYDNISYKRMLITINKYFAGDFELAKLKGYYKQGVSIQLLSNYFNIPRHILKVHLNHGLLHHITPICLDKNIFNTLKKNKYGVFNIKTQEYFEFFEAKDILKLKDIKYSSWGNSYKYIHKNVIYDNLYIMYKILDKEDKINYFLSGKMNEDIQNSKNINEIKRRNGIKESQLFMFNLIDTTTNKLILKGNKYDIADLLKITPGAIITSYNKKSLLLSKYKILKYG